MNTYGLASVNNSTFNLRWHTNYGYDRETRNIVVTCLRLHNATLNILGYMPRTSRVSGCIRMISGFLICATTLAIGERRAQRGVIIQHYYDEALFTGIAQIFRGAVEAFAPYGRVINASLDVIATFINLFGYLKDIDPCQFQGSDEDNPSSCPYPEPHPEPNYPGPLELLYLV